MLGAKIFPNNLSTKSEVTAVISTFSKQETKTPGKFVEKLTNRTLIKTDFRDKQLLSIFNQTTPHLSIMTALQYSLLNSNSTASIALIKTGKQGLNQHFRLNSNGRIGYAHSINLKQFKKHVKTCKLTVSGESQFKDGGFEKPSIGLGLKFTI